jgi:hypothetical protein
MRSWSLGLAVALAVMSMANVAGAQQPLRVVGNSCPSGYHQSGNFCIPQDSSTKPAMYSNGNKCPSGYYQNGGNYCLRN